MTGRECMSCSFNRSEPWPHAERVRNSSCPGVSVTVRDPGSSGPGLSGGRWEAAAKMEAGAQGREPEQSQPFRGSAPFGWEVVSW